MDVQLEHSTVILTRVHDADSCFGPVCSLHNRSNHSMRAFPQSWRADRFLMERICPHGIGHPDPDDPKISMFNHTPGKVNYELLHECDNCCAGAYGSLVEESKR